MSDYLEHLQEEYIEPERYAELYVEIKQDTRISEKDALDVARHFRKGEEEEGLELLGDLLG